MKIEELNQRLENLRKRQFNEVVKLKREYALSNNTVKIGDIISDHMVTIVVESIDDYLSDIPQCVYTGIRLTKQGVPTKKIEVRQIYQQNIQTNDNK